MKAIIAGAGIGGLTTALFLHRAGIEVEVFERAEAIRELGVGINMLPHAVQELAALGLLPSLDENGIRTRELIYANRFGQIVWRELRGLDAGHDCPQISIHRGRLLGLIHATAIERLGGDAIRTGCQVAGFSQSDGGVRVELADRDGIRFTAGGDLLIGADGIHSAVRGQLYPDEGAPVWSGIMLWRGCTHWPTWRDGRTMAIAGGNTAKFVFYPIGVDLDQSDTHLTNWAVMAQTGSSGASPPRREDWSRPGVLADVLHFVRDRFRLDFVDPAEIIRSTPVFYEYPNCDRNPLPGGLSAALHSWATRPIRCTRWAPMGRVRRSSMRGASPTNWPRIHQWRLRLQHMTENAGRPHQESYWPIARAARKASSIWWKRGRLTASMTSMQSHPMTRGRLSCAAMRVSLVSREVPAAGRPETVLNRPTTQHAYLETAAAAPRSGARTPP